MTLRFVLPVLALGLAAAAPATNIVDGDTFTLGAERVRLWGVDAPEGRQVCQDAAGQNFRCGDVARDRLVSLIGGRPVDCRLKDRDTYGRMVAQCSVDGRDLGEAMVRAGWAVEYRQFSRGTYAAAEVEARTAKRGLWAGTFDAPDLWRAAARHPRPAEPLPPGTCVLKGNINAKGNRIFHAPGQRDYMATVIDAASGERWFCTAAEAVAAGWTAAAR
jgi:endonuclease YncB( thermonuclease family)